MPPNIFQKPLLVSSVPTPHPGQSYNPEKKSYVRLVRKVVRAEKKKVEKQKKILKSVSSIRKTEDEINKEWMDEMSQGLNLEPEKEQAEEEEEETVEDESEVAVKPKKKEVKKKKKTKKAPLAKVKKAQPKSIKKILKEIKEEESQLELRRKKRDAKLIAALHKPKKIRGIKPEDKVVVPMPHELTGSLRSTKLNSNLLKDRFTSIQERSLVDYPKGETRSKSKVNKPWVKWQVKRSSK